MRINGDYICIRDFIDRIEAAMKRGQDNFSREDMRIAINAILTLAGIATLLSEAYFASPTGDCDKWKTKH